MKKIKTLKICNSLNKKQKLIVASILILVIILLIVAITTQTTKIVKDTIAPQKEEIKEISYRIYNVDENNIAEVLVILRNEKNITSVTYKNEQDKDFTIYLKNKNKVAIDYKMQDRTQYKFNVEFEDTTKKEYIIDFEVPRIKGNYILDDGIYVNEPDVTVGLSNDYTRYMYLDENKNLVPGNWINGEKPENWYNYGKQEWANIYTENDGIGSYFVWIPRYCYKIDKENSVNGNERMDVKFINTYNQYIDPVTNNITEWKELKEQGYQIPQAFSWGENVPNSESANVIIPGYWISKYQLSEVTGYIVDYEYTVNTTNVEISNVKINTTKTVAKCTYALNGEIKETLTDQTNGYTFTNVGDGKQIINVTALDELGEIIGSYTATIALEEPARPDTSSFDQDTTFYVWYDEQGNEHNETPLKNEPPEKWYKYSRGVWANIVSRNNGEETYYTWIPRYEYRLNSLKQRSEIKFVGTDVTNLNGKCTESYQVPDAFWWDNNNNGKEDDGEQLAGYWITKYQLQEVSNYTRIDANIKAGSDKIRIKEFTGSLINSISTNNTPIVVEYYLNGEKMQDAKGNSLTENYIYKNLQVNTTYTINIIVRNKETNEYIGAVTKKLTTIEPEPPVLEIEGQGFNKEETYYVWYDDDGTEHNDRKITETPPDNWYDYSDGKWANIVTKAEGTLTYFVWIPRYEYKLDASVNPQKANVNFVGTDVRNGKCSAGYKVPDAFWWDNNNNGKEDEGEQLTGYWITKHQLK